MATEWYVAVDGAQKGPLSTPELKRWVQQGKVAKDTLVKEGPNGTWRLLGEMGPLCGHSMGQALLNLIGLTALLAIGAELYLFMATNPATRPYAPWGAGFYLLLVFWNLPRWTGKLVHSKT